ncbi:AimR family lysis-lysogeny pheromone receptor [Halalkalibacter alkaliphilus]|uniref:AimR family lysis-lysogeny pheromone receptor n=1 Tax=Halalkalibacter alkaliphilus TaxID=2917993 RepID=A0A9X2I3S2_9BACI|nr:AimR family lysis-lysogeny pheromone receptor [Halalkalibacter alkaliphilus]MCL7747427.1 AimR family lysis-lysogeny pheromone receptor [Halalkalibacter alkaliphilus]
MVMKQITAETFSEIDNLEEYVNNVDPNSYLARVSLEYLVINSKSDLVETLIGRLLDSSSEESREWAEVYKIDHLVYKQEMNLIEAIQQLTYTTVRAPELSTLIKVFQLYNYSSQKEFEMIASLSELVNAEISRLEEGFMKTSLLCRYMVTMQSVYLHLNDVEKSRECGIDILKIALTQTMKVVALTGLGNSFILSNKEKALEYFNKSLTLAVQMGHEMLTIEAQRSSNFTYCYWEQPEKVIINEKSSNSLAGKLEEIFHLIKSNEKEKALFLLDQIKFKIDNDYFKAFDQYYRGLINRESKYFEKSIKYFEKAGDYYYRKIPLKELNYKEVKT